MIVACHPDLVAQADQLAAERGNASVQVSKLLPADRIYLFNDDVVAEAKTVDRAFKWGRWTAVDSPWLGLP